MERRIREKRKRRRDKVKTLRRYYEREIETTAKNCFGYVEIV